MSRTTSTIVAAAGDIDELGHVNNSVWVRWVQDVSVADWRARADPAHVEAYYWVIVRHEIDFRGNIGVGERVEAATWLGDGPKGAKYDRHVEFVANGRTIVRAKTTWAIVDRATGQPVRVPAEVIAPFRL